MASAKSLRAAVAFVTLTGVGVLRGLLEKHSHVKDVAIVARGAPVTEPAALLALRDELGVEVSAIAGPAAPFFHPKLWLSQGADTGISILSGSGNLTAGGLRGNREQFEISHFVDPTEIEVQEERFRALTENAIALDDFEDSIAWRAWVAQLNRREKITEKLADLDRELYQSNPTSRNSHKAQLMRDLWDVYERTRDAKLKKENGNIYVPGGLRLQLEGKRGPKEPVPIAANICKSGTEGFDTILRANRADLTVEFLVVDQTKDYHDLFPEETRRLSAERLQQFSRPDEI